MAASSLPSWRADALLRPMPMSLLAPAALIILLAGAAYCLGYEGLSGGVGVWPLGLLWSAYAVWPWFFLFEYVKRREWAAGAPLDLGPIAILLVATGALSVSLEFAVDRLRQVDSSPLALQMLRRLPAIAATLLLMLLARRERRAAEARSPAAPEGEVEALLRQAGAIRWIQAADNYLELHLDGRVSTHRVTMREAASILEPLGFVRIHRSFIVNGSHVEAVVQEKGSFAVKIANGDLLPVGRAFSRNIRRLR